MKTKIDIKTRLVLLLRTDVSKYNRYIKFCLKINWKFMADLSEANLSEANLSWANLSEANLSEANLSEANLSKANLSWANLSKADLSEANLSWANLSWANLSEANLSEANLSKADLSEANLSWANLSKADLDFSCLHLSCKSLKFFSDIKIRTQIGFHFASLIANAKDITDEEKEIFNHLLSYVNKFHRTDVPKLNKLT